MPKPEASCGTYTAYLRHRRRDEPLDEKCEAARDARTAERRVARSEERLAVIRQAPSVAHELGVRGAAFYEAVIGNRELGADREALVVEVARMADRLEQLNDVIAGKGVLNLMHFRVPHALDPDKGVVQVEMSVDHVMSEARQLQLAFDRSAKSIFAEMALIDGKSAGEVDPFDAFLSGSNVVGISAAASRKPS